MDLYNSLILYFINNLSLSCFTSSSSASASFISISFFSLNFNEFIFIPKIVSFSRFGIYIYRSFLDFRLNFFSYRDGFSSFSGFSFISFNSFNNNIYVDKYFNLFKEIGGLDTLLMPRITNF